MLMSIFSVVLAATALTAAQRPNNTSICDYYTTALLKDNNATNQATLLTLLVNTAVIGNYTKPNVDVVVPGILAQNQTYNGEKVNLLPYFTGMLASSNRGGQAGVSVNFLDGGGAAPLLVNKPANGTSSAQFKLLTHLYAYFDLLLGCSHSSQPGLPAYPGTTSMYQVHKFMALNNTEVGFFIEQVALSAKSFGVADADIAYVGKALGTLFGERCAPEMAIVPGAAQELQAICTTDDCPLSPEAPCSAYAPVVMPKHANATMVMNGTAMPNSTATSSGTHSGSATSTAKSGAEVGREWSGTLMMFLALGILGYLL